MLPSVKIFIMNTQISGSYQRVFSLFHSKDAGDMDRVIVGLKTYGNIKDLSIVGKRENSMSMLYAFPKTRMFREINDVGFRLHPIVVKGGVEKWYLMAYNDDDDMPYKPNDNEETDVVSAKKLTTDEFISSYSRVMLEMRKARGDLSSDYKESDIVEMAYNSGYYEWPRRTTITRLSKKVNIPKSTLTYKLRKGEKNLLDELWQDDKAPHIR